MAKHLTAVAIAASLLLPPWAAADLQGAPPEPAAEGCRLRWAMRGYSDGVSCLGCHEAALRALSCGRHVLGGAYEEALQRSTLKLRPRGDLPPSLVMRAGRITCTTCHDPWSRTRKKLAVARATDICTSCHEM